MDKISVVVSAPLMLLLSRNLACSMLRGTRPAMYAKVSYLCVSSSALSHLSMRRCDGLLDGMMSVVFDGAIDRAENIGFHREATVQPCSADLAGNHRLGCLAGYLYSDKHSSLCNSANMNVQL